jgi:Flp pilus assembly protein TadG
MVAYKHSRKRGFVMVASAICALVLFGMAGLAIDLGRLYICKNEAQSFADSAALYAAQQLNSTAAGITAADAAVAANPNKWNFATTAFGGTTIEYSADGSTGWATSANYTTDAAAANVRYVRVTAVLNNVALFLLPVTGLGRTATVKAAAVSGQTLEGTSATNPIRNNVFPYSPIAPAGGGTYAAVMASDPTGNFGFTVGQQYDLKWPGSPTVGTAGNNKVPCAGDDSQAMINRQNGAASQWGEVVLPSASGLATAITTQTVDDAGGIQVYLNQSVTPTNGTKNSDSTAINERVAQDGDTTSTTYADYINNPAHNGRRLITTIVNSGYSDSSGNALPSDQQAIGVGFAQFLLLPSYSKSGGSNNAWCAIYVGPAPLVDGSSSGGSGTSGGGVAVIRLAQ